MQEIYFKAKILINIDNRRSNSILTLAYVVKIMILNDFEMVLVDAHPMFKKKVINKKSLKKLLYNIEFKKN